MIFLPLEANLNMIMIVFYYNDHMAYIPQDFYQQIEKLKKAGKFTDALKMVNSILVSDPEDPEALMQIADIQYQSGEVEKAEKAVDFLLQTWGDSDPMVLYTKGILAMEKTQWHDSLEYLQKAIKLTKFENAEVVRAYAMAQYWYGNHQKGIDFLLQAYDINKLDAEIVYNLIQVYTLEHDYRGVRKMIVYFDKYNRKLQTFDKDIEYYSNKILLYKEFISDK